MSDSYIHRPMVDFLADAAADKPTPGGGAVAALCGALAGTMASMAANFTAGRKKFADVESDIRTFIQELDVARSQLIVQMDADIAGYAKVGAAYGMPRETAEQKTERRQAVQGALRAAMAPPSRTAELCVEVLAICADLLGKANPNLLSDVGVAAVIAEAAMRAAHINVRVNLALIKDESFVAAERRKLDERRTVAGELAARVAAAIDEKM